MAAWTPFRGVLWLVWDGASFEVVRELVETGNLPELRRLSDGNVRPLPPLEPNCQTPPSLASKFTGTGSGGHGLTGFRVPALDPPGTLAESSSGFERSLLDRPLVWDQVVEEGGWAGTSHTPWTDAGDAPEGDARTAVDAYERARAGPAAVPLEGCRSVDLGGGELLVEPRSGGWEVCAPATGDRVALTGSGPLRFEPDPLRFGPGLATRVGAFTVAGHSVLVHTGLWEQRIRPRHRQPALDQHVGAFAGKLLGQAYGSGALGPRAFEGGDGTAEEALLESARLQAACFRRSCVTRVSEPERGRLGDLFLRHRPGYECRAEAGPSGAEVVEVAKGGTHLTPTGETTLQGMLAVGAGVHSAAAPGRGMTLTDLVPWVEDLLAAWRISQAT